MLPVEAYLDVSHYVSGVLYDILYLLAIIYHVPNRIISVLNIYLNIMALSLTSRLLLSSHLLININNKV
jgi:hypothetical protein